MYREALKKARRELGLCFKHANPITPGYLSCEKCREDERRRSIGKNQRRYTRLKQELYQAYGSVCRCCGEANKLFLTFDHINNDGAKHRKEVSGNSRWTLQMYHWLKKNNFPPIIQTLCYNCNCGRARNKGVCPHKG